MRGIVLDKTFFTALNGGTGGGAGTGRNSLAMGGPEYEKKRLPAIVWQAGLSPVEGTKRV